VGERLRAHDVDVAVQKERAARPARQRADERAAALVRDERDAARVALRELLGVGLDGADLEPELAQSLVDERLCGLLVPERRGNADELPEELDRSFEAVPDGTADVVQVAQLGRSVTGIRTTWGGDPVSAASSSWTTSVASVGSSTWNRSRNENVPRQPVPHVAVVKPFA
jgi:hypothetical protein